MIINHRLLWISRRMLGEGVTIFLPGVACDASCPLHAKARTQEVQSWWLMDHFGWLNHHGSFIASSNWWSLTVHGKSWRTIWSFISIYQSHAKRMDGFQAQNRSFWQSFDHGLMVYLVATTWWCPTADPGTGGKMGISWYQICHFRKHFQDIP